MAEPIDDQRLLRQLAQGDEGAFRVIYNHYQRLIHRFAWHMSGNHATAEEITQEVFMLLVRKPRKYDPAKGSLGGYLFGVARNLTRRSLEKSRSMIQISDEALDCETPVHGGHFVSESEDLLATLTQQQLIEVLRKAILSLPSQYREVIVLCDLEQMTQAAAAELLQCSPGTIASRMHRARALLRLKLLEES